MMQISPEISAIILQRIKKIRKEMEEAEIIVISDEEEEDVIETKISVLVHSDIFWDDLENYEV